MTPAADLTNPTFRFFDVVVVIAVVDVFVVVVVDVVSDSAGIIPSSESCETSLRCVDEATKSSLSVKLVDR